MECLRTHELWPWQPGDPKEPQWTLPATMGGEERSWEAPLHLRQLLSVAVLGPKTLLRIVALVEETASLVRCRFSGHANLNLLFCPDCWLLGSQEMQEASSRTAFCDLTTSDLAARQGDRLYVGHSLNNAFLLLDERPTDRPNIQRALPVLRALKEECGVVYFDTNEHLTKIGVEALWR